MGRKFGLICAFLLTLVAMTGKAPQGGVRADSGGGDTGHLKIITLQEDTASEKIILNAVKRFKQANKNYSVTVEAVTNDRYKSRMTDYAATDRMPDVFMTWTGGTLKEYIGAGKVADLSAFMNEKHYRSRFPKKSLQMVSLNRCIWAVPVENMTVALIYYNKTIFKRYHLTPPTTYSQLLTIISRLRSHKIIPFALANRTAWSGSMFYMYLVDRLGGPSVFRDAASRKNGGSFANPVFIRAGKMVQQLVKMGAFPDSFNFQDEDAGYARELMYNGSAGMSLTGSWFPMYVKYEDNSAESNLGVFPFPSVEGGKGDPDDLIGSLGDNFYSISSACPHKRKAFELIQYLIDDTAVRQRIKIDEIPPVNGVKLTDPLMVKCYRYIRKAPFVQFWYDQYLPPRLANKYLVLSRRLFGGASPQKTAQTFEAYVRSYYHTHLSLKQ